MGQRKKSILVMMLIATIASIGFTSNQAFAGLGPLSASQFGDPQPPVPIDVAFGPCPAASESEGCAEFLVQIRYDPDAGPMVKHFDISSIGTFFTGEVIHVGEELQVLPLGANPTGEWSDWHEQIITPGWEWQPGPTIDTPPGVLVTDLSSNPQELWLVFDPPILSTDPLPHLIIQKYLVCQPFPASSCADPFVEVHQFPTLDIDFGDLIDPSFPTLLASDGARHFPDVLNLGVIIDTEPDGQPSPLADKDDLTGGPDDEDNISFTSPIIPGATASVDIIVTGGTGVIDTWIDFNLNGIFDLPTEKLVFSPNAAVSGGTNPKTFPVPAGASPGIADSRWRVSTSGAPLPTGYEPDGEVEDHRFTITTSPLIGGELFPIDTTALLLAGGQMTAAWLIPVIVAGAGFVWFLGSRKSE